MFVRLAEVVKTAGLSGAGGRRGADYSLAVYRQPQGTA